MQGLTSDNSGKRLYTTPQVTVHGTLEELTKQDKDLGGSDGFTFQQQPIQNVS
jgi:hypothetical protein